MNFNMYIIRYMEMHDDENMLTYTDNIHAQMHDFFNIQQKQMHVFIHSQHISIHHVHSQNNTVARI